MNDVCRKIAAFFFPERCPFCGKPVESDEIACARCTERLQEKQKPILRGVMGYRCVSSFLYDGKVRKLLIRVKFYEYVQHIRQLAVILAKDIRAVYPDISFDLITYVPMYPKDQLRRGYNQAELLCQELSKELGVTYAETLKKIKRTKKQHTLTYAERRKNLAGAFDLIDRAAVRGKNILIVDDIVTSGNTLGACCKKLNQAKPALLCCAAIADAVEQYDPSAVI